MAAPLAGVLAMASLAAGLAEPAAAAETGFLAFAAGLVLLAAGAVARGAVVPVLGTATVVALAWIVPAGPSRGFLVEAAAAFALVLAAVDRMGGLVRAGAAGRIRSDGTLPDPTARAVGPAALLRPVPALGLAFGLQALLRADELLAPPSTAWALVVYAALPAVGALATLALARLDGPAPAALATATVLLLGPGFRPATVTALTALVAAAVLLGERATVDRLLGGTLTGGTAWVGLLRRPGRSRSSPVLRRIEPMVRPLGRAAAAAVLLAPAAWSPSTAFVAALAGAAFALRRRPWAAPLCCVTAAGGAWASILAWGGRPLPQAAVLAAAVALAVPTLAWPARGRVGMAATAMVLAVAAAIMVSVDGALAAPGALAAAAVAVGARGTEPADDPRGRAPRAATALQGTWSGLLLAGAALAGAYPWLRPAPFAAVLGTFGVAVDWTGAVGVVALVLAVLVAASVAAAGLGAGRRRSMDRLSWRSARWSAGGAAALAALALLLHVSGTGFELVHPSSPVVLSGPDDEWSSPLDGAPGTPGGVPAGGPVRAIVLDSALGNAADLLPGTPVATLAVRWTDRPERSWTLRAGEETGEWAVDRDRRRGEAMPAAPSPWRSWIPAGGRFFGHRYRAALRMTGAEQPGKPSAQSGRSGPAGRLDRVEIRLRPDLPPGVALTVFRLELRP